MRIKYLACLLPLLFCLTGCLESTQLNERALMQAIGIDRAGDGYRLTLQIFDPQGGGTTTAIDASKTNCQVIFTEGKTISQALSNASLQQGKEMFYGHNKLVVLGEDTARQGIGPIVNFLNGNPDFRPNVDVAVCKGLAKDVVAAKISQGLLPALEIQMTLANEEKNGRIFRGRFYQVMKALSSPDMDPCVPWVEVFTDEMDNSAVRVVGSALFSGDKMTGTLDLQDTQGLLWACNAVKNTLVEVPDPRLGTVSLQIIGSKTKLSGRVPSLDAPPEFTVKVRTKSQVQEVRGPVRKSVDTQNVRQLQKRQAALTEDIIGHALYQTVAVYDCDPIGLERACGHDRRQLMVHRDRWKALRPHARFAVEVTGEIESFGLQKEP